MKPKNLISLVPLVLLLGACSLHGETGPVGPKGDTGETGPVGPKGDDGKSIVQIIKTSSEGNTDTYTIVYSDSSTTTFTVTNGKNGEDGHSPEITISEDGYWCVDGKPTTIVAKGDKGDSIADITYAHDEDGNTIVKITLSNGEERYVTILKGEKGDKGDTGEQGPKGDKGDQGEKGDKGDNGDDAITYIPCIFNNYDGTKLYEFYYEKGSDIVYDGPTPVKTTIDDDGTTLNWTFVGWDKSLENIQKPTIFTAQFEYLYTVKFVNYDGSVLETKTVNRGYSAAYDGPTPMKPSEISGEQTIEWRFTGWDKKLGNIKSDMVFTAQYDAPNAIKLTFNNYDGTLLYTQYCGLNANVIYQGPKPTKPELEDEKGIITKYEFSGFDKSLRGIKEDTTFTSTFSETTYYRCRFYGDDGSLLYTTSTFAGGQATYKGETPIKEQEANGTDVTEYSFNKWDKPTGNITAPTDFYPLFDSKNFTGYKVTFMDSNNKKTLYSHYFKENTSASYPFETPWSYDNEDVTMFIGWSEPLSSITKETTVHMNVKTLSRGQNGEYPQSKVTDENLLNKLNSIDKTDIDLEKRYLELDGNRYRAVYIYSWQPEASYYDYYLVEPIKWRYIAQDDDSVLLLSEKILDVRHYNDYFKGQNTDGFYANNYKESEIRKWLNNDFLGMTFTDLSMIKTTAVDNSVSSTGSDSNSYVCETTNDKVFLLSYSEATNPDYGFDHKVYPFKQRIAYATDYAKHLSDDASSNDALDYWLRSPSKSGFGMAWFVNDVGGMGDYLIDQIHGIRPALRISL